MTEGTQTGVVLVPLYEADGKPSCTGCLLKTLRLGQVVRSACVLLGTRIRVVDGVEVPDPDCPLRQPGAVTVADVAVVLAGRPISAWYDYRTGLCDCCGVGHRSGVPGHAPDCEAVTALRAYNEAVARLRALVEEDYHA